MPQVTYLVTQQVRNRLAHPLTGFNPLLAAACSNQTPQPEPYVIDFSDGSFNFWQSQITAEELDSTSSPEGSLCILYGRQATNQTGTAQKFATFSGTVQVGIDIEIAWPNSFDPSNTEGLAHATEDAVIECFNATPYYAAFTAGVIWNGLIDGVRGPMRISGPGWRQKLSFSLTFELQT